MKITTQEEADEVMGKVLQGLKALVEEARIVEEYSYLFKCGELAKYGIKRNPSFTFSSSRPPFIINR